MIVVLTCHQRNFLVIYTPTENYNQLKCVVRELSANEYIYKTTPTCKAQEILQKKKQKDCKGQITINYHLSDCPNISRKKITSVKAQT